jgi:predicted Ser/Thr protein kinase
MHLGETMVDLRGKTLGNYQIGEELGRGGMAVVYRAYQPSLNRYVAIKVLPPQLAFDRQFVERFLREARSAAGLRHPNIVVVHDVGEQNGLYYIVMEYLEGRTLKEVIEQEGSLPPDRVARILEQVAAALDYAHARGFIHRDVKPANIFVGEGDRVTLTDFGIAKAAAEAEQLTRTGTLVGTPEYMSPEQAEGGIVDPRTDLYALGVVLYQMLTGQVPFKGNTPHSTLYAVVNQPPPPPRQLNPALPPAVEAVVLKAVAKRPDERFQRGAEMASALQAAVAGRAQPAAAPPPRATPPRTSRRQAPTKKSSPLIWILAALAAVLVLTVGALALLLAGGGGQGTPAPTLTQAVVWQTPTVGIVEVVATSEPVTMATTAPTETQAPPANASEMPTPTETSEPVTGTPTPTPTTMGTIATSKPPTDTPTSTPTNTPKPPTDTPTPTPTSPPPCAIQAQGAFAGLWQAYRNQLGCPLYANPKAIQDAEQAFDNGHMFWRSDNDYAYVVYQQGARSGTYQAFSGMWSEGDPEYSCSASPPPGKVQPKRGFGAVWCTLGGAGAPIGWGLGEEVGFGPGNGDPLVQDFERGVVFRDSDGTTTGRAYILFGDGSFVRQGY